MKTICKDQRRPKQTQYPKAQLKRAHKASFLNGESVKASEKAGCFHCCKVYPASQVNSWVTERCGGKTAKCPCCGIDSVMASKSGYPLTKSFLSAMEKHWFNY